MIKIQTTQYDFTGKVCLVTGGASGMGRAFAEKLAACGARVAIADINQALAEEVAASLGDNAIAIQLDATDPSSAESMAQRCVDAFGCIDVLVNSIGIGAKAREGESPYDIWRRVMDVNINGVYNCCIAVGETMVQRKTGKIINIASISAYIIPEKLREGRGGEYGLFAYTASKASVRQLTRAIAALWAKYGVIANSVSPGYVNTPLTAETHGQAQVTATLESKIPLGYIADPGDIVGAVCYLASDESSYMTGNDLVIDGGKTCL